MMRRREIILVHLALSCAVACATTVTTAARAQSREGFALARFDPAEPTARWFVVDALDLRGHVRPALGATLDFAYKPLVAYDASQSERRAIVRYQTFAHASLAMVVVPNVRVGLDVPVAVLQDGEAAVVRGQTLKPASRAALGDVRFGGDVAIVGEHDAPFRLALGARVWMPTGVRGQFAGDGALRAGPQVLAAGDVGVFGWAARAAFVFHARDDAYAGTPLGSAIDVAVGAGVRAGPWSIGPEVFASTRVAGDTFLRTHGTPADVVLGVRHRDVSGLEIAGGVGGGLSRGFGSPALRALVSIGWGATIAPPDRDRDGILDGADACPDVPGIRSGDPEQNGCPEPEHMPEEDSDLDTVGDRDDACPTAKGVRTTDPMTNGCPPEMPRQLAIVTTTEIRIGEEIRFETDSADLVQSDAVLAAVEKLLSTHPEIQRVRIEGHTDDTGSAAHNDDLSRRRAEAVLRWLVDHGVDAARLVAEGFGSRRPLDTSGTDEARAKNRRVIFTIVERARP